MKNFEIPVWLIDLVYVFMGVLGIIALIKYILI